MPAIQSVALVDFWWNGHHPTYFRFFYQTLVDHGCRVIPFCPKPEELHSGRGGDNTPPAFTDEVMSHRLLRKVPAAANVLRFKQCARALGQFEKQAGEKFDRVVFTSLYDGAIPSSRLLPRTFPYLWSALLL